MKPLSVLLASFSLGSLDHIDTVAHHGDDAAYEVWVRHPWDHLYCMERANLVAALVSFDSQSDRHAPMHKNRNWRAN